MCDIYFEHYLYFLVNRVVREATKTVVAQARVSHYFLFYNARVVYARASFYSNTFRFQRP